jgi:hypothetical protein
MGCQPSTQILTTDPTPGVGERRLMVIIEKIDRNKLGHPESPDSRDNAGQVPSRKIVDFHWGPQAARKGVVRERARCGQADGARSFTVRLPDDRLEFLLTIAIFFALLLGLYVGLIAS